MTSLEDFRRITGYNQTPGLLTTIGNALSSAKDKLNELSNPVIDYSYGVENKDFYNNLPQSENPFGYGNLLLGQSGDFLSDVDQRGFLNAIESNPMGAIDTGLLAAPTAALIKPAARSGSKFLSSLYDPKIPHPPASNVRLEKSVFDKTDNLPTLDLNKKEYHAQNDMNQIIKNLAPYQKDLESTLNKVAPNNSEVYARVKLPQKIQMKIDAGKQANQISDYMGGRIVVDNPADVIPTLNALDKEANIIQLDNYFDPLGREGYRAVHAQIMNNKGATAEVQIIPKSFIPVNDAGKAAYDALRHNASNLSPIEKIKYQLMMKNSDYLRNLEWQNAVNKMYPKPNLLQQSAPILEGYLGGRTYEPLQTRSLLF